MLNEHRPQPGRLDRSAFPGLPPRVNVSADAERAPVTFGWALHVQGRFAGQHHLETLYRLDRVGAGHGNDSAVCVLQPSEFYGQSTEALRTLLRVRQHGLLPRTPPGHRWIGPELIEEVPLPALQSRNGAGPSRGDDSARNTLPPQDPKARLQFARDLAAKILQQRALP
jgi:hypothetical protein